MSMRGVRRAEHAVPVLATGITFHFSNVVEAQRWAGWLQASPEAKSGCACMSQLFSESSLGPGDILSLDMLFPDFPGGPCVVRGEILSREEHGIDVLYVSRRNVGVA